MPFTVVRSYSFSLSFLFKLCKSYSLDFTHSKIEAFGGTQVTLSDLLEPPKKVNSAM